jgi:hypothetical protein
MKRGRMAAALAAGLVVSAIVAGTPAGAGDPAPTGTITVDPTSGRAGDEYWFSGEGCVSEAGPGVVDLSVFFGETLISHPDPAFVIPHEDGSWRFGIVPIGHFATAADAVGTWEVMATCFDAETEQVLVEYETATFEVTQEPAPPTTAPPTTAPQTTTTTVAPSQASIMVSPSTAAQGDTVTISGHVPPSPGECSELVRLTDAELFPPDGFGPQVPLDAKGGFVTIYTIPADTPPGTYSIGMRCGGGNVGVSATLQVTQAAAPAAPVPAQPSFTG